MKSDFRNAKLRAAVEAGFHELDQGRASPFNQAAVERIRKKGRALLRTRRVERSRDTPIK